MQIIKDRKIVDDTWQHVADDAALPTGKVIVSLARWRAEKDALKARGDVGVCLPSDAEAGDIADDLAAVGVVVLHFPVFRDGRPYSTARLLRDRYGYQGELRATGDVLRDQIFYMHRCGFDAFEIRPDRSIEDALKAFDDFSVTYQPAADQPLPLFRRNI